MKLALVISSLNSGGAERVLVTMANYWVEKHWDIALITLYGPETDFYALHPKVRRVALNMAGDSPGLAQAVINNIRRVSALRRWVRACEPDAVISFVDRTNVLILLATRDAPFPVIVAERIDPRVHFIGRAWEWLRSRTYPMADALVVQTHAVGTWASRRWGKDKVHVIANAVLLPPVNGSDASLSDYFPFMIAIGRLDEQKGFDLLLHAFARVSRAHPDWSLIILGEGPERANLQTLALQLRVANRVRLPGRRDNPFAALRAASLFVLPSRYEGFPNVLLEAMACGLPVISFDCPSGPSEIIEDGVNGILVPAENVDALAEAIERLTGDEQKRKQLSARAPDVLARFSQEAVMGKWEDLLRELVR